MAQLRGQLKVALYASAQLQFLNMQGVFWLFMLAEKLFWTSSSVLMNVSFAQIQLFKRSFCSSHYLRRHIQFIVCSYTHACTHSSGLFTHKGQDPGYCLGLVSEADRLSNGWAGQAHARQPWGEWLLGNLAVRARQVDRTVRLSHCRPWWRPGPTASSRNPRVCGERVMLTGRVQRSIKVAWLQRKRLRTRDKSDACCRWGAAVDA